MVLILIHTIGGYVLGKICLPKKGVCPDLKKNFFLFKKCFIFGGWVGLFGLIFLYMEKIKFII
jgi:hypothetical protein